MSDVDLLNDVLDQEHAAAYAMPVIAARVSRLERRTLLTRREHLDRIEAVTRAVEGLDGEPVTAQAAYPVPPVGSASEAADLAVDVERACLTAYVRVVREGGEAYRPFATDAMIQIAERLLTWGAEPEALPGLTLS